MPNPKVVEVSVDDLELLIDAMESNWYNFQAHSSSRDDCTCRYCGADQDFDYVKGFAKLVKEIHLPTCPLLVARALIQK